MSGAKSIEKALAILTEALGKSDGVKVSELQIKLGLPAATIYRQVSALERFSLVHRSKNGRLLPGALLLEKYDLQSFQIQLQMEAKSILANLSNKLQLTAHLGVFDRDMVTYTVKTSPESEDVFTEEGAQLEAYCSGIGKVLLAGLPKEKLHDYLDGGPFPALTGNTISDTEQLAAEIQHVAEQGYAIDNAEIEEKLFCLAVPVYGAFGSIIAGLSLSSHSRDFIEEVNAPLTVLRETSAAISTKLYPSVRRSNGTNCDPP